jgi:hypothetical protein
MKTKITAKNINNLVSVINGYMIRKHGLTAQLTMDKMAGGWRLQAKGGSVNVSPRLQTREMFWWLDGFIDGIDRWWVS